MSYLVTCVHGSSQYYEIFEKRSRFCLILYYALLYLFSRAHRNFYDVPGPLLASGYRHWPCPSGGGKQVMKQVNKLIIISVRQRK